MNPIEALAAARRNAEGLDKKRETLERRLADLRKEIEEIETASESDGFVAIAAAIAEALPGKPGATVEVLGPQGIDCLMSLHVRRDGRTVSSLTFRPSVDGGYRVVDYGVDTKEYAPGTMAAMNGMNHPDTPMPDDVDVLVRVLVEQEARRRQAHDRGMPQRGGRHGGA